MEKIEGTLVTGHLARVIESYRKIEACHQVVEGFEHFTTEAIIYARLEWSKFIRDIYTETDRIHYLYDKCFTYDSPGVRIPIIDVTIDDYYGIVIEITHHPEEVILEKKVDDGLPF
jgi:hypothetical protein